MLTEYLKLAATPTVAQHFADTYEGSVSQHFAYNREATGSQTNTYGWFKNPNFEITDTLSFLTTEPCGLQVLTKWYN